MTPPSRFRAPAATRTIPLRSALLRALAPCLACAAALSARPATAQLLDSYFAPRTTAVGGGPADQSQTEALGLYDAPGVRVGKFLIRPELTTGAGYNTNAQGISNGRGSPVIRTNGGVTANSDWSRNSTYVTVSVDDQHYLDLPQQSFTNWTAGGGGTVDIGRDSLSLNYLHQNLNETPGSIDPVSVTQAVPFQVDTGGASYAITGGGRLVFVPAVQLTHYSYSNFTTGSFQVNQAYRDRLATEGSLTTRYQIASGRDAVLVIRGTHLSYETNSPGVPQRDSNTIDVLAGLDVPARGSNFRFRVLAGVQVREYDNAAYSSQTTPTVEASVIWTPTRLTTVTLLARRDIQDAADESIAAYTLTAAKLGVEHELRRNVVLTGFGQVLLAEFQSARVNIPNSTAFNEAGTSQTIYGLGTGIEWKLNRNMQVGANYELSTRTGSTSGSNYTSHTIFAGVTFRL